MAEMIDMRTDRERLYDEQSEVIRKRYDEILPIAPCPSRAMAFIGKELGLSASAVRGRLIKMGVYVRGTKKGRPSRTA